MGTQNTFHTNVRDCLEMLARKVFNILYLASTSYIKSGDFWCEILYEHSNYFDASKWTVKGEICGAGGIKYSGLERAQGEVMTYE